VCTSIHLVRRLGEVECRDCGWVGESVGRSPAGASFEEAAQHGLADEVEQALARVLRRSARPASIS